MKKSLFFCFILISHWLFSQDIDFYLKTKNQNFLLPSITKQMSADEFQLLSRNIRMQDFIYAAFVPGYIHFQAKDYTLGYTLLGLRLSSYALLTYENYKYGFKWYNILFRYVGSNISSTSLSNNKIDIYIINTALSIIIASYLFDVIDGQARLHKKQELIRYKYSLKFQLYTNAYNKSMPMIGFNLKF